MINPDLLGLAHPVSSLSTLPGNPRRGDVEAVAASLKRFGQRKPIVARASDRVVIAGNHTLQAAVSLGWDEVAVSFVDENEEESLAFALADNRTAELGDYDDGLLLDLIRSVGDFDPELLLDTGWSPEAVADLVDRIDPGLPDVPPPDDAPEPPAEPFSKLGDVWVLGWHRVVCGDSTDVSCHDALLMGEKPRIVFTDPPYGIAYQAMRGGRPIENDSSAGDALRVTTDVLALVHDVEAAFVCCDWRSLPTMLDAMRATSLEPKACIVWDKQRRVQNLDRFAKCHEMILYAGPYGGEKTQDTDVWSVARDFDPDHPTPKPVELVTRAVVASSRVGDIVLDPFGGSGSTLMACEYTGRKARLIELDPRYVDVICRRWQEHTGAKPVLESTGAPHDFTGGSDAESS